MNMKRVFNLGMVVMMLVTSFAVSQPVAAQATAKVQPSAIAGAEAVPGEIVVAFADSQDKNLVEKIEQAVETANTTDGEVTRLSMDGSAVIHVDGDTAAAVAELNSQPGVLYAEQNYVYSVPAVEEDASYSASSDYVFRTVSPSANTNGASIMAVPNSTIQSMVAMGIYPTDQYLTTNQGWFAVGADIVWPNTTPSANICMIDTGVDSAHPDLKSSTVAKIIAGYDFVNADAIPADDNGHGTHLAGIMVAIANNKLGVSGVSTGKVVAVKALDAQGVGTNFDIAMAIAFCANRTDIRVINLSLGGPSESDAIHDALLYATTPTTSLVPNGSGSYSNLPGKGKLVVVAAGNKASTAETYPAGYSNDADFPGNVILSVGSAGLDIGGGETDYTCSSTTSNKNASGNNWINVVAPGENIYSTTPYDIPFYQNYYGHLDTRYAYLSGTSMAAAFVSASAARRMGYKPAETNTVVGTKVVTSGDAMDSSCTFSEMLAVKRVNVASLLERTAIRASVFDAASGIPLNGADVSINYLNAGVATSKSSKITTTPFKSTLGADLDPARLFTYYNEITDILDVQTVDKFGAPITSYQLKVNKSGYTAGYQPAFQQDFITTLTPGSFNIFINGAVPPTSPSFNVVLGWHKWQQPGFKAITGQVQDLDLYVWLPQTPGPDLGQPASFVVGYGGDAFGLMEGDSYGTLNAFPFARLKREGGFLDGGPAVESIMVLNRAAHAPVLANKALPYWAGTYTILATDYGQIIDHDNDGCGSNYGYNFNPSYAPGAECSGKTPGIPLLGAYFTPYVYVWKDGTVKHFVDGSNSFGPFPANDPCNKHWWKPFAMTSAVTDTVAHYSNFVGAANTCDNGATSGFIPYTGYTNVPGDRITVSGLGK